MRKNALLLIDVQNDFCDPNGALFVPGAEEDSKRTAEFIEKNGDNLHYISMTQDSHQVIDISHPAFWQDKDGNPPAPFTIIKASEARDGIWAARYNPALALKYLEDLETQGEFPHCIWPEHCIIGSEGAAMYPVVMNAVKAWAAKGHFFQIVQKGEFPLTEHFGAFRAQIPVANIAPTQLNDGLIKTLTNYQNVYFAGQAKSHCVANTLKQAMEFPELAKKLIILEDCMSNVPGFETLADPIYDAAKQMGVRFMKSTDVQL